VVPGSVRLKDFNIMKPEIDIKAEIARALEIYE
jgi:hypothetical protein